ncbi:MAG: hypothetical protein Q9170_000343 [Blastenia crenularia]
MTALDDRDPTFWTLDHLATQQGRGGDGSGHESYKGEAGKKYTMIGIGVGVAVGVFAITTAVYALLASARRKEKRLQRQLQQQRESKGSMDKDSMTKSWVLSKPSLSSNSRDGVRNGFLYELDAKHGRGLEIMSRPVG